MKTLEVEDKFIAPEMLRHLLAPFERGDITENGKQALSEPVGLRMILLRKR